MSAEKFSGEQNSQGGVRERLGLIGKKIAFSATLGASLATGVGLAAPSIANAAPVAHITHQNVDPNGNEVIIVGGTNDPDSVNMPGYQAMLPKGVYTNMPTRIHYPANFFTYNASVNEGARQVRDAIERTAIGTRIFVFAQSQGAHAGWNGVAQALGDQPERAGNINMNLFGDPGKPGGIFDYIRANPGAAVVFGMGGVAIPPPRVRIAATVNEYCIEADPAGNGENDSMCNAIGDVFKVEHDWQYTHPHDLPDAFE